MSYLPIILLLVIIIIQNLVEGSSSCKAQTCNGLKIREPFWIPTQDQPHCGSPGFNITCNDMKPTITINGNSFIIRDIFYENSSLSLAHNSDMLDTIKCAVPHRNFTVEATPFSYGPNTTDLFFFYNCSVAYDRATYAVDCASNGTRHSFAVFHVELLEHWNYSAGSCEGPVNAPVEADAIDKLLKMNYTVILDKGFVLQWSGNKRGNRLNWGLKIGIGVVAAVFSAIVMCIIFSIYHHHYKSHCKATTPSSLDQYSSFSNLEKELEKAGVHIFDYHELEEATDHFDPKRELGDGGYGTVYRGELEDGRVVAVKRLYDHHLRRVEQFLNEVEILTRLRHQNLVTLYGCTSCRSKELLLVYEYIPNGTLADHLHGGRGKMAPVPWITRLSIAMDTANALAYLHASDVIHRDIKSSNILLDNNFVVKVGDFGLSRLVPVEVTHISTGPQGTPGYVDPEYSEYYQLTEKSDVYSFGVVLIELISSRPAVDITRHRDEISLSTWAINKIQNQALGDVVDPCLGFEWDYKVRRMISDVAELAFQCLQSGRDMRPQMQDVSNVLKEIQSKDYSSDYSQLMKTLSLSLSPNSLASQC